MTVAVTRTKAEQGFAQNFEGVAGKLPGGRAVADVRKAAIGAFAALGLPHRRLEEWKYTDLRGAMKEALPPAAAGDATDDTPVTAAEIDAGLHDLAALDATRIVFVNGVYRAELSAAAAPKGLEVTPLAQALGKPGLGLMYEHAPGQEAVVALNTAYMTDGAVVRVASKAQLAKPVLLVFARAGSPGCLITTRNIVQVGAGAQAILIEAHVALAGAAEGQDNALSEVAVGEEAELVHVKVTLSGAERAAHLATWMVGLATEASYRAFHLTAATKLARNAMFVTYHGEGANIDLSGVFLGRGSEHIDTTLVVDHAVPGCVSRELFKGVLADGARGVFQGKVIVRPNAQKTDGKQMAQVLMLSEEAEFDSKPELEIHADDVVCGHGSTSADIDEDMLFYMRARGIGVREARALLIESFIGEAIDKIEDEAVREAIAGIAKTRLAPLTGNPATREG